MNWQNGTGQFREQNIQPPPGNIFQNNNTFPQSSKEEYLDQLRARFQNNLSLIEELQKDCEKTRTLIKSLENEIGREKAFNGSASTSVGTIGKSLSGSALNSVHALSSFASTPTLTSSSPAPSASTTASSMHFQNNDSFYDWNVNTIVNSVILEEDEDATVTSPNINANGVAVPQNRHETSSCSSPSPEVLTHEKLPQGTTGYCVSAWPTERKLPLTKSELMEAGICVNWNMNKCRMGQRCKRDHKCSFCQSTSHSLVHCKLYQQQQQRQQNSPDDNEDYFDDELHSEAETEPSAYSSRDKTICLNYNILRCSSKGTCRRSHVCSFCSMSHPLLQCPSVKTYEDLIHSGIEICYKYNMGSCTHSTASKSTSDSRFLLGPCKRLHLCLYCNGNHSQRSCNLAPNSNLKTIGSTNTKNLPKDAICFNWNKGTCRYPKCKRLHLCSNCFKDGHRSTECPLAN